MDTEEMVHSMKCLFYKDLNSVPNNYSKKQDMVPWICNPRPEKVKTCGYSKLSGQLAQPSFKFPFQREILSSRQRYTTPEEWHQACSLAPTNMFLPVYAYLHNMNTHTHTHSKNELCFLIIVLVTYKKKDILVTIA